MAETRASDFVDGLELLRVLVLEDDPGDAELIVAALARAGFRVEFDRVDTPEGFQAGLAGDYDVILADFNLRSWTALEALEIRGRSDRGGIPFILVTGSLGDEAAVECLRRGAADYVLKDRPLRLGEAVRRALELRALREEQARAEKALRQSEERLRLAAKAAGLTIWDWDVMHNQINWSGFNLEAHLGLAPGQWGGHQGSFLTLVHPEDRAFVERCVNDALDQGTEYDIEFRFVRGDSTPCWVASRGEAVRDASGAPIRMMGAAFDISGRKRTEEALRESEERLRMAVEATAQTIWDWDLVRNEITWSGYNLEAHLGLPAGGFGRRQQAFLGLVHPEDRQFVQLSVDRALAGGPDYDIEFRYVRTDGSIIWVTSKGKVVRDADGRPIRMIGVSRDITQRKVAEEALVKLRKAVDASGEVVFTTSRDGTITFINPEFTRLYGYAKDEVVGKTTPRILKSGSTPSQDYARFWQTMLEQRVAKWEFVNRTKVGNLVTVETTANLIWDEHGIATGFLAIQRDVTARKQLEQQLHQAQKMEAVGRLAGGIAHDFNNLLTIISGRAELLLEQTCLDAATRSSMEEVRRASERAASLTRQLLAFSRRQVMAPQALDLNSLVANLEKMLKRLIGEDIRLATLLAADLATVKADPSQIEQVIMNLAVNSRDAMPRGGQLTVRTANKEVDEGFAAMRPPMKPGSYVMLAVSDTGCGMDEETQSHIFEPFFTTKEAGKGTGLGLATVYGIVKQSGGFIWAESDVGVGSTFRIYLPQTADTPAAIAVPEGSEAPSRGSETVLVVEDEAAVRTLVRAVLTSRGYQVLEARSGAEAFLHHEKHEGPLDLLLTDIVMPDITGLQLAEHLAPSRPGMAVLYMSGYPDDAIAQHGILAPGTIFLQKPFTPEILSRKVREALSTRKRLA